MNAKQLSKEEISGFQKRIFDYYRRHRRDFPWRNTTNPYYIFISEVMLQQTQTTRVKVKYPEFIRAFPTFKKLAVARLRDILQVWSGMGYNRRGKYLKEAARIIVGKHKGLVPKTVVEVDAFPGIGTTTAGSIVCFSYNLPTVFIETNIRRAFIHFFFRNTHEVHDKEIYPLVEQTIDRKNPREWYYALMDYGSMLAKMQENPNKKSRHYVVQSRFEGSDRKIRGQILRLLLGQRSVKESVICKRLKTDKERTTKILHKLAQEGLIVRKDDRYFIQ